MIKEQLYDAHLKEGIIDLNDLQRMRDVQLYLQKSLKGKENSFEIPLSDLVFHAYQESYEIDLEAELKNISKNT